MKLLFLKFGDFQHFYLSNYLLLKEENLALKEENAKLEANLSELKEKYRLLTITKTLEDKKDKTDTKKKINEMVREIDNCIRLLNN